MRFEFVRNSLGPLEPSNFHPPILLKNPRFLSSSWRWSHDHHCAVLQLHLRVTTIYSLRVVLVPAFFCVDGKQEDLPRLRRYNKVLCYRKRIARWIRATKRQSSERYKSISGRDGEAENRMAKTRKTLINPLGLYDQWNFILFVANILTVEMANCFDNCIKTYL